MRYKTLDVVKRSSVSTSKMDRLTQIQIKVENLIIIIYSTFNFILKQSKFKSIGALSAPSNVGSNDVDSSLVELSVDLLKQFNQLRVLIDHLPHSTDISTENFNDEYVKTIEQTKVLNDDITNYLNHSI